MANPDRPNGFLPAKSMLGAPWTALVRRYGITDGTDLFRGDAVKLASNLAAIATSGAEVLGVVVGFGRDIPSSMGEAKPMFNAQNLENAYYDDSESTDTEWYAWVCPAEGVLFEVQTALDLDLDVGDSADLSLTTGSLTTGTSKHEITTSSNVDVIVVENIERVDNDITLINARHLVMFANTEFWAAKD